MNKIVSILLYFLVLIIISTSCIGIKMNASKNSKSYYETFHINDSVMQYFIKPMQFKGKLNLKADFTFKKISNRFSTVTMNFSVISNEDTPLELIQINSTERDSIRKINLLFKEKKKSKYKYRYTSNISYMSLYDFFSQEHQIINYNNNILLPTVKSKKIINRLYNNLFRFE